MYKETINFEIKPIFSPSLEMCKKFADIDIQCLPVDEQCSVRLYDNLDQNYFTLLSKTRNPFAFGAYKSDELIGFTSGFLNGENTMFTNALYVRPECQGFGIGSSLLNTSDCAASLIASNMRLVPLEKAVSFYQERDYKNVLIQGRIHKIKKLPKVSAGIVPVFDWTEKLSAKLNVRMDTDLLKQHKHQPIFVYVNDVQRIDGVATRLSDGKEFIEYNKRVVSADMLKCRTLELSDALYMTR